MTLLRLDVWHDRVLGVREVEVTVGRRRFRAGFGHGFRRGWAMSVSSNTADSGAE